MPHAGFVHLRVHSAYSLLEGAIKIDDLVARCRREAMAAVAAVSVMVKDWLTTYKMGLKTSYYQNTYDTSNDGAEEEVKEETMEDIMAEVEVGDDDHCDSCAI